MADKYRLGANVTEQAKAREHRGTVVVSFRLRIDEFDELTDIATQHDRTVSEMARRSMRLGLRHFAPRLKITAGNEAIWSYD